MLIRSRAKESTLEGTRCQGPSQKSNDSVPPHSEPGDRPGIQTSRGEEGGGWGGESTPPRQKRRQGAVEFVNPRCCLSADLFFLFSFFFFASFRFKRCWSFYFPGRMTPTIAGSRRWDSRNWPIKAQNLSLRREISPRLKFCGERSQGAPSARGNTWAPRVVPLQRCLDEMSDWKRGLLAVACCTRKECLGSKN